ncbi:MAG TPA: glycosyltransferase family 4 protein [Candidatus Polarisedimenticolia bacterium]|nr:glycosyltransferase family 4 protein [Candidatus Polarisedimenticolia bacterium]
MPSVLLVTQDLQRAGAQRQCVELALGLKTLASWNVEIAVLEGERSLESELTGAGIPIRRVPRRWRWDLSPATGLGSLARQGGFDVIHSFMFLPNFYVRLSRLRHRTPLIVCSHRTTKMRGWPRAVLEILLSPFCDLMVTNSQAGREELVSRGMDPGRIAVVLNGIDLDRFRPAPASGSDGRPARVGMVARMEPDRDHVTLLQAFEQVHAMHPEAKLVLAGDGSLAPKVREQVALLRLESCVELPGAVAHPEEMYRTLDLYVQASRNKEGTSNSLLEAMASGIPVIATRIGGNLEVVRDGETGLLVTAEDPAALAKAISSLLRDPVLAQRLGAAGAARVRDLYSRTAMVDATLRAYASRLPRLLQAVGASVESSLRGEG